MEASTRMQFVGCLIVDLTFAQACARGTENSAEASSSTRAGNGGSIGQEQEAGIGGTAGSGNAVSSGANGGSPEVSGSAGTGGSAGMAGSAAKGGGGSTATCTDSVKNGSETDVDCGGICPQRCGPNEGCGTDNDCTNHSCVSNKCQGPVDFKIQYYRLNTVPTDGVISARVQIYNSGNSTPPASQFKIRYWYTNDGRAQTSKCVVAQSSCSNVTVATPVAVTPARTGGNYYLEVGFGTGYGNIPPGQAAGTIDFEIDASSGTFDETDDYSYDAANTSLTDDDHLTLYQNGSLIWGKEP